MKKNSIKEILFIAVRLIFKIVFMNMAFQGYINQICIRHSLIKINVLDCCDEWTKILLDSGYRTVCLDIIHNSVVNG